MKFKRMMEKPLLLFSYCLIPHPQLTQHYSRYTGGALHHWYISDALMTHWEKKIKGGGSAQSAGNKRQGREGSVIHRKGDKLEQSIDLCGPFSWEKKHLQCEYDVI